jgi:hypothetical protein
MKKSLNVKTKVVYVHLEDVANVNPSGANVNPSGANVNPSGANVNPSGANVNPSGANVNPSGANVNPMWIHVIKRHWIQKLKCYRLLKHDYNWIGSRSIRYVKHT